MGSGAVFFDYDDDGLIDLYFVNSAGPAALYRNQGNRTFRDRAEASGVSDSGFGLGCAAADYDGDGAIDLYVTGNGPNILYRGGGTGGFSAVTEAAGVTAPGLSTGAAFGDLDRDGDLDLYVATYIEYDAAGDFPECYQARHRVYCGPQMYQPRADLFFRNDGDGSFTDATGEVGLLPEAAKELGAFFSDYDDDGDLDLYVAGDRTPNLLYRNDNGRFAEVGILAGAAYNDAGKPLAGMGVTSGDYDNDGRFDLFVTNYQRETNSLYHNLGSGFFADVTFQQGLGVPSLGFMGWGTMFLDYDNDGDRDLFVANGHLDPNISLFDDVDYPQQNQLFRNDGEDRFSDVSDESGPGMKPAHVSRGAARGDYDNDGDLDVAVANNGEPANLLRNDGGNRGNWLQLHLKGGGANSSAIGAKVTVKAGGLVQVDEVRSGSSYLCQNDLRLFFGLGDREVVDRVEIRWPLGRRQILTGLGANRILAVEEPAD